MKNIVRFFTVSMIISTFYACNTAKEDSASKKELKAAQENYDALSKRSSHNTRYLEASELFHQQNAEIMSLVLNIIETVKTVENAKVSSENITDFSKNASLNFDLSKVSFEKVEEVERGINLSQSLEDATKALESLTKQLDVLAGANEKFLQEDNQSLKANVAMLAKKIAELKETSSSLLCAAVSGQCKK